MQESSWIVVRWTDWSFEADPIGTAGFEPATPATPLQCATGLRYVPDISRSVIVSLPLRRRNP